MGFSPYDDDISEGIEETGEYYRGRVRKRPDPAEPSDDLETISSQSADVHRYYGKQYKQLPIIAPQVPKSLNRYDAYRLQAEADTKIYMMQLGQIVDDMEFHLVTCRTLKRMDYMERLKDLIEARMASGRCSAWDVAIYRETFNDFRANTQYRRY